MQDQGSSRRIMKLLTMVGGLAVLLWAMRDRFISIPTEREETPSSFRASNGESPK